MASPFVELDVEDRVVRVSNPDKVYFRSREETKLDLVEYYRRSATASCARSATGRRTSSATRTAPTPRPIYQKRVPEHRPDWVETVRVTFPSGRMPTRSA